MDSIIHQEGGSCMKKVKTDECIVCGEDTDVPQDCSVDDPLRSKNGRMYLVGHGQLCPKCAYTTRRLSQ